MGFKGRWSVFFIILSFLFTLSGCKYSADIDIEKVKSDALATLAKDPRLAPDNSWAMIDYLDYLSQDTLSLLSINTRDDIEKQLLKLKLGELLVKTGTSLQFKSGKLQLLNPSLPENTTLIDDEALENELMNSYSDLELSDEIFIYQAIDGMSVPYLCRNECSCMARVLFDNVLLQRQDLKVYRLQIHGGAKGGGVRLLRQVNPRTISVSYAFHVALLVVNQLGHMAVVDPIVAGSAELLAVEDWFSQFEHESDMTVIVDPLHKLR